MGFIKFMEIGEHNLHQLLERLGLLRYCQGIWFSFRFLLYHEIGRHELTKLTFDKPFQGELGSLTCRAGALVAHDNPVTDNVDKINIPSVLFQGWPDFSSMVSSISLIFCMFVSFLGFVRSKLQILCARIPFRLSPLIFS